MAYSGLLRGFSNEEFEKRVDRAQRLLHEEGISALLVCTEPEVRYLTGFHTPFWQSPTRPWFVILPRSGKPVAVIPSIGEASMSETWIDDIRTWSSPNPSDEGVSLLAETLREILDTPCEISNESLKIGLPMGNETHLRMPLIDFQQLNEKLSPHIFVDATEIIKTLRCIKSEEEIAKITKICEIVSDGFASLSNLLNVGMTEREAFQLFRLKLLELGADEVPYLVGATGPGFSDIIKQPSDRVIEPGDLVMFDTGSTYDGYFSDFDRNMAFQFADDKAKSAYKIVWEATEAALKVAVPGNTTSDLWEAMASVLETESARNDSVGRFGHGLGMQVTEWPSNTRNDGTVLQEGMVLTVEPNIFWGDDHIMVHEENFVIRSDGVELLSRRAASELEIIT
ncbi:MAG: Xaa-Pro peptidase family protein [Acidimicrobiales bacterium]|jgi:Xaa-Pro aminopeptidase|nr:peptidase M24 [Acidimicrobiaceae bacterium]MDP6161819.1 Xaa-Pro peptidase family protein [Acidimicrobiales bacterium]MDP6323172.1 Xaa-Pro peptidase family protein [Acidimicrobiales bacterium]HJO40005.1 Xaa-Pro peptidase family protein [Acidimicrobiales bacterium]